MRTRAIVGSDAMFWALGTSKNFSLAFRAIRRSKFWFQFPHATTRSFFFFLPCWLVLVLACCLACWELPAEPQWYWLLNTRVVYYWAA